MPFCYKPYPSNDDDYIGNESCNDYIDFLNFDHHNALAPSKDSKKVRRCIRHKDEKKEFPPPIPFLAQTQNLASHMPYVLKRFYTNEGRLIIKEEKVKHHEYFHASRENGRLTLKLVPLDHDDYNFFARSDEEQEEEEELASPPTSPHKEINDLTLHQSVIPKDSFEEEKDQQEEDKHNVQKNVGVEVVVENENEIVGGANSRGNCLNCKAAPSGIFGVMPLHPIRTVRS